jgi:8-amino-7-oxononanoate synthase
MTDRIRKFLADRMSAHTLRTLHPLQGRAAGTVQNAGRQIIDFSSNDYLGYSQNTDIIAAATDALQKYGMGAGASRLMSGDLDIHHDLENITANYKSKEVALCFTSGYCANTTLISALVTRHDAIFADALIHASLIDGAQLSQAKLIRYRHNDIAHLQELLDKYRGNYPDALIITESIFSMDGDRAPLKEIVKLKQQYNCRLFVDEAHATGVFGSGIVDADGVTADTEYVMGTFSKALGSFGGYLACDQTTKDYLINAARGFVYTTALPPAIIAANIAAIKVAADNPQDGENLLRKSTYLRDELRRQGWQVGGESQIIPVVVGNTERALQLSEKLADAGMRVLAIRPPTVPDGSARLRLSLCAMHTDEQLRRLLEAMNELK